MHLQLVLFDEFGIWLSTGGTYMHLQLESLHKSPPHPTLYDEGPIALPSKKNLN